MLTKAAIEVEALSLLRAETNTHSPQPKLEKLRDYRMTALLV
jgi:hypothetical protein